MSIDTKPEQNTADGSLQTRVPQPPTTAPTNPARRNGILLALVGFFVVGSSAFFLGRSTATAPPPAPLTAENHGEETHVGEEHGETGGDHKEEEGRDDDHGGLIKLDAEAAKTAGIRVEPVRMTSLGTSMTVPGTVEVSPNRGAKITPPVQGKVVRLLANVGQTVRAGQPIIILDSVDVAEAHASVRQAEAGVKQAEASLHTAHAGVQQARTSLQNAEKALASQRQLAQAGVFSQPSLQAAQAAVTDAEAALQQAKTEAQNHQTVLARAERLFKEELIARAELEQAQAEERLDEARVRQAEGRLTAARQTLTREQRLAREGLLSRQALQANEAEVRTARSELQRSLREEQSARTNLSAARAAVTTAQSSLRAAEGNGHTEGGGGLIALDAPISGIVTQRNATLGEAVERTTELFVIENLQTVIVIANIPERDISRVRVGQRTEVTVAAYPQKRFPGVVESVGSRVDEKTRALPVRVLVENPTGRLRPDMFATVSLATDSRSQALTIPSSAIGEEGSERFVFVQENEGYERRDVQVGRTDGTNVEILKGLTAGDRVVTEGVFVLKSEGVKAELKGHDH